MAFIFNIRIKDSRTTSGTRLVNSREIKHDKKLLEQEIKTFHEKYKQDDGYSFEIIDTHADKKYRN